MKVKQLIERLKCFDENQIVVFPDFAELQEVGEIETTGGKLVFLSDVEETGDEEE